jgi:hypothetical protein
VTAAGSGAQPMRIALVGTRGVPARYGGFETCVEEVGTRLAARGHDVVVYCRRLGSDSSPSAPEPSSYRGMTLVHLGALKRRSLETLSHTGLSVAHLARHRTDAAVVFNSANSPWLPVIRMSRIPVATHVDGLEWQRGKWGPIGRRYYQVAERLAVWWSKALIADAVGIADYYRDKFDADTDLISYGAPRIEGNASDRIAELGLRPGGFHLVVARFEPENHVDVIVDGYRRSAATLPLVVVGSAPYADEYTRKVHALADERVRFLGGVWDQELLDQLYANSFTYLHGHSVGAPTPRCCALSGPVRRPPPSTSSSTARCSANPGCTSPTPTTSPGWWSRARPTSMAPGRAGSSARTAHRSTTGTTSPTGTRRCADGWLPGGPAHGGMHAAIRRGIRRPDQPRFRQGSNQPLESSSGSDGGVK